MKYALWLAESTKVSTRNAFLLIEHFGSAKRVFDATEQELKNAVKLSEDELLSLKDHSLAQAEAIIRACAECQAEIITLTDERYPNRLKNIYDPPTVLYVKGTLPDTDEKPVLAVVGSRHPKKDSVTFAEKMAAELSSAGFTVISGLAEGVDGSAQKSVCEQGGVTVAVLGTAIDNVYPEDNRWLAREIIKKGAYISEYPPGKTTYPACFVARNRIISALSDGVLVIQAHTKSGSLATARFALEQNRDVFVSPGPPLSAEWTGSFELIKEGAYMVTLSSDIIDFYSGKYELSEPCEHKTEEEREENTALSLSPEEAMVYAAINGKTFVDEIVAKSGLKTEQVLSLLTMMELSGAVTKYPGQLYERN